MDKYLGNKSITAVGVARNVTTYNSQTGLSAPRYDKNPYTIAILPTLGLTANSDVVSIYLEPYLGYFITEDGNNNTKLKHELDYGVYGEIYINPIKNLEWHFEAELGNAATIDNNQAQAGRCSGFNASTGIIWYLPVL